MERESGNYAIEKYYAYWRGFAKWICFRLGMVSWSEDILHNVLVELLLRTDLRMADAPYIKNFVACAIKSRAYDAMRAKRTLFDIDLQYDDLPGGAGHFCSYDEMSDEDFARFREVSCNIRSDDFIVPVENGFYITPRGGWVSGWIHSYKLKDRRYTYWQYSAFVGSRSKGDIPKRIKTSISKHEAYVGLMKYNKQLMLNRSATQQI